MYLPSFDLKDRVAVVTGAGRGIGRALAIGLAEAGADVALLSRTQDDLDQAAEEIRALGRRAYPIATDVTSRESVSRAISQVVAEAGRIDILVNNAGMNIRSQALDVTDDEWETIMQTNLKSAFLMSQETARQMKETGGGRIINIASVAGAVALRTGVVYGASKAALMHMTRVLSMEWAKHGIQVNAIGPWYFRTPLTENLLNNPEYLGEILDRTPMKRVGELQDLVGPTVFLASEAAAYVTGQVLMVDGGMSVYGF
jgi:NAD(P)-dependent dehydrogenase (short-subunit alcohol dehydrogenase family)